MSDLSPRIPEDIADEVLKVASELYAEAENSYAIDDLKAAGEGVNIPPEIIDQAIAQVQEQRRLATQAQEKAAANRQKLSLVGAGLGALALLWGILAFNSMSSAAQKVDAAWAQVENVLQRRAELIPKLVKVTKAQSKNENKVIKLLVSAQEAFAKAQTPEEKLQASAKIDSALQQFDKLSGKGALGSSQAFSNLEYAIAGADNRIATEKKRYNEAIAAYNQKVSSFPNSIVATFTGMKPKDFLKATNTADPQIKF